MKKNEILMTSNYGMFKLADKNRDINQSRVERQIKAIKKLNLTAVKPVIVNEKMEIVDGQHTFEACKKLGYPIYYVRASMNGKTNEAIISLNANQTPWSLSDYVKSYAKRGYADYALVIECMEKYGVTISTAISFVANSDKGDSHAIRNGNFKRGSIPYSKFGDILMDFKQIASCWNHILFIRALVYVIKKKQYDHASEFPKFVKNRKDLMGCATKEQYFKMFEDILNSYRRGPKIRIGN